MIIFQRLKHHKTLVLFGAILLVLAVVYVIFFFFAGVKDTAKVKTHASFTSLEMLDDISQKQGEALKPYIEKAIEVEGFVKQVSSSNNRTSVFLSSDKAQGSILCELQQKQPLKNLQLKEGQRLKIKGIYKGYLLDAILLNCIVLETNQIQ